MRGVACGLHDFLHFDAFNASSANFFTFSLCNGQKRCNIYFFLTMAIGIKSSKVAKFMNSVDSDCQLHPLIAGHKKEKGRK